MISTYASRLPLATLMASWTKPNPMPQYNPILAVRATVRGGSLSKSLGQYRPLTSLFKIESAKDYLLQRLNPPATPRPATRVDKKSFLPRNLSTASSTTKNPPPQKATFEPIFSPSLSPPIIT